MNWKDYVTMVSVDRAAGNAMTAVIYKNSPPDSDRTLIEGGSLEEIRIKAIALGFEIGESLYGWMANNAGAGMYETRKL